MLTGLVPVDDAGPLRVGDCVDDGSASPSSS